MTKLIIWVSGRLNLHGHRRGAFIWNPTHACHIFDGKEIATDEFNEKYARAMQIGAKLGLNPQVRAVGVTAQPAAAVATITAREITAEEAEAVLQRLAPDRLKKKPGRKPVQELEVA